MNTRSFLILLVILLSFLVYLEWQKDYVMPPPADVSQVAAEQAGVSIPDPVADASVQTQTASTDQRADLPQVPDFGDETSAGESATVASAESRAIEPVEQAPVMQATRRILVETDVLQVEVDANGGSLVDLRLKDYPESLDHPDELTRLFMQDLPQLYIAQMGLVSSSGQFAPNHGSRWEFEQDHYALADGAEALRVPLRWQDDSGLEVTATWVFHRGRYVVDLDIELINHSEQAWEGARYLQLERTRPDTSGEGWAFTNPKRFSYSGTAIYSPENALEKMGWDDMLKKAYQADYAGGWAAMIQHYFLAAWIPPPEQRHRYTTSTSSSDQLTRYRLSASSPRVSVAPGERHEFNAQLIAGPKLQNRLEEVAPGLRLTVDYRIFTIVARPIFWTLDKIHSLIRHWGWSIIILTLLIKLVFFKLTEAQFRSMGKMRKLQPRIQALKERYGDDRQKFGQAMMEIYRKEKVNPLGGCLPVLVQIPIFISLYWVLLESVELRQTAFMWVPDLSRPDPLFILPALNGVFMIITQRLSPATGMDPMQRRLMQGLPVVFAFLFALFPAGLVLYWATNSGTSLAQQWYILRRLDKEEASKKR